MTPTPQERKWRHRGMVGASERLYQVLLKRQGGRCAVCRKPPKTRRLSWDHDHRTGRPRGLLCFRCNGILIAGEKLGGLPLFRAALRYLEAYEITKAP